MRTTKTIKLNKEQIEELLKQKNLLPFNRKINKEHAMSILDSINTYGMLRLPVLAKLLYDKGRLAIADSQHGLYGLGTIMSSKDVQECIVVDCENKKDVIDLIAKLNTTSKSWKNEDFLSAWLKFGADNEHYAKYKMIDNSQRESDISLSKVLDIFVKKDGSFKKGNIRFVDNIQEAENVYKLCKNFRLKYKTAAHAMAGVIQFAKTKRFEFEEEVESFILRTDARNNCTKKFPKDREDIKAELELIYDMRDSEFNNYIKSL